MPTTFDKAVRFTANAHKAEAAPNAAYNDLPQYSIVRLLRCDETAAATIGSKGNSAVGQWTNFLGDGGIDFRVERASGSHFYRGAGWALDGSWQWLCLTFNRATGAHTRFLGPKAGTMAAITVLDTAGGSGLAVSDATYPITMGTNGANNASRNMDIAFEGWLPRVLTLAEFQALSADALSETYAAYWKPGTGMTTSVPNGVVAAPALPALVLSGATIVNGPDAPVGLPPAVARRRRRMASGSSLY